MAIFTGTEYLLLVVLGWASKQGLSCSETDKLQFVRGLVCEEQLDALLHGHSYTAHAIGCSSAVAAIKYFSDPSRNANLLPDGRRLREVKCLHCDL